MSDKEDYQKYLDNQAYAAYVAAQNAPFHDAQEALQNPVVHAGIGAGKVALDIAARAGNLLGGTVRTAGTQLIDPLRQAAGMESNLHQEGDWRRTLEGEAPSADEILGRAGVPEGLARSAAGIVGDIATDPLTYASFGASAAAKAPRALRLAQEASEVGPLRQLLEKSVSPAWSELRNKVAPIQNFVGTPARALGEAIYGSSKLAGESEQALKEAGKGSGIENLLKNKIWGTAQSQEKQINSLADKVINYRNSLIDMAEKTGTPLNDEIITRYIDKYIDSLKSSQTSDYIDAANELKDRLSKIYSAKPEAGFTPQGGQQNKTNLYEGLRNSYGNARKGSKGAFEEGEKHLARGFKEAVENSVDAATGQPGELAALNDEYGRLVTPQDILEKNSRIQSRAAGWTPVDSALIKLGGPGALAAKKAGDLYKTNLFKSGAGNLLYHYVDPLSLPATNEALKKLNDKISPWEGVQK